MAQDCGSCGKTKKDTVRTTWYSVSDYGNDELEKGSFSPDQVVSGKLYNQCSLTRSITEHEIHRCKFYRPISNRTWVLALFLLAFGIAILLLELAVASHPDETQVVAVSKRAVDGEASHVPQARQVQVGALSSSSADTLSLTTSVPNTGTNEYTETATSSTVNVGQPGAADLLAITTDPSSPTDVLTGQPAPSDLITITTASSLEHVITPAQPTPADLLTVTAESLTPTAASASHVQNTESSPQAAAISTSEQNKNAVSITSLGPIAVVSDPGTTALSAQAVSAAAFAFSSASLATDSITAAGKALVTSETIQLVTLTGEGGNLTATMLYDLVRTGENGDPTAILPYGGVLTLTDEVGRPTATISYAGAANSLDASRAATTSTSTGTNTSESSSSEKTQTFTQFDYFLAMYFPTLFAFALQCAWLVVFADFKKDGTILPTSHSWRCLGRCDNDCGLPLLRAVDALRHRSW